MATRTFLKGSAALRTATVAAALALPTSALAEQVTLKSSDGTVNIVGDFVAFENNSYVIRTGLGELRLSAARVSCEGAACPSFDTAGADVTIAGSDTVGLGLMPLLLAGYAAQLGAEETLTTTETEGEIIANLVAEDGYGDELGSYLVSSLGSAEAFSTLLDGSADIGMSARRILPAEARELRESGAGNMISPNNEHIIAVDSLVVITHPENPVELLDIEQLRDIYAGRITNWSEVGGPNAPITVIERQVESGTRSVFSNVVFGEDNRAAPIGNATVLEDNTSVATAVNDDPNAIGYVGYAFQRGAKALPLVNECGITMRPDAFSARTEEYSLQRRLYLYNRDDRLTDESRQFVEFAKSEDADGVIAKSGFIDLGVARQAQPLDGERAKMLLDPEANRFEANYMREMLNVLPDYDRLSTTFRFRTGSSKLDERGILDMQRLTNYLQTQPEGTTIKLVGFTDDVGAFESNLRLAEQRAERVLEELEAFAGDRIQGMSLEAAGYGEIAPSACNISEDGRRINRRVEVWISNGNAG